MIKPTSTTPDLKEESVNIDMIQGWRGYYVDVLVSVFTLIACFGMVSSVIRYFTIGWLDIFYVHLSGFFLLILVFLYQRRLSTNIKCFALITVSFIGGLAGTLAFGLAGTGIIYVILASLFAAIFVNRLLALFIIASLAIFLVVVGFLFSQGQLQAQVDLNEYVTKYSSWVATLLGPIFISVVFVLVISNVRAKLVKALLDLEEAKSELKEAALHDPLTGLPNLRYLNKLYDEHTLRMNRDDDSIAVMLIDLDDFKPVNDRYGHLEADGLLVEVAQRMKNSIRSTDTAARVGGDEFIVLLRNVDDGAVVREIAQNMISTINAPYEIMPGEVITQGVSIGASILRQDDSMTLESLLKQADLSMYKLKALGKNGFYLDDEHFFKLDKS